MRKKYNLSNVFGKIFKCLCNLLPNANWTVIINGPIVITGDNSPPKISTVNELSDSKHNGESTKN